MSYGEDKRTAYERSLEEEEKAGERGLGYVVDHFQKEIDEPSMMGTLLGGKE